jgi:hypothetical protein
MHWFVLYKLINSLQQQREIFLFMVITGIFVAAHTLYFQTTGCRSQWPKSKSGLRPQSKDVPSSLARTLGSCVRFSLEAWVSVCVYSVFVMSCVQVAALRQDDPPSKESYRLCKRSRNWKSGQGPTKDYTATDRWMDGWMAGWMDGWMDGWTDGRTDRWTDR